MLIDEREGVYTVKDPMLKARLDYEDEGISFEGDGRDGGMYYPSEMSQYVEEDVIHYSGGWDSGCDGGAEGEAKSIIRPQSAYTLYSRLPPGWIIIVARSKESVAC